MTSSVGRSHEHGKGTDYLISLFAHYGLLLVAVIIFAGEIGLPTLVPGEIALLIAGSQFIHSTPALIAAILLFGAVDITATSTVHLMARSGGNRLLVRLLRYIQRDAQKPEQTLACWRQRLGGRDPLVVFVTRMIPMFRLYASITTGLIRIRFKDFLLGAGPAAWVWATTPLTLGYLFRRQLGVSAANYGHVVQHVVTFSIIITMTVAVLWWMVRANPSFAPRRFRLVIGTAAFLAAFGRLIDLGVLGAGVAARTAIIPNLPALPTRVTIITLAALGLLVVAARDLRMLRTGESHRSISVPSAVGWVALTAIIAVILAWNGTHPPMM